MQLSVGSGVIDGSAYEESVGLGQLRSCLIYDVVEHAAAMFAAESASDASAHILYAYVDTFDFHSFGLKGFFHFTQTSVSASVQVRAAVDYEYFHLFVGMGVIGLSLMNYKLFSPPYGCKGYMIPLRWIPRDFIQIPYI